MSQQRVMTGVADFTGHEIGTLKIEAMIQRWPSPRYACFCKRCKAKQTVAQRDLSTGAAICRASGCGREHIREAVEDSPRKYAQRLARKEQDKVDALKREFEQNQQKIAATIRERLLNLHDVDFPFSSDNLRDVTMTQAEADGYNQLQAKKFVAANPSYYPTAHNVQVMGSYLARHGIALASAAQLQLVYQRLDEFGCLERRPEPAPEPVVNLSIDRSSEPPEPPKRPEPEMGWDLNTGKERAFSAFEISRMNADEYKRTFRLYGDRQPRFPSHPLF